MTRVCSRCESKKPLSQFYFTKTWTRGGEKKYSNLCKPCEIQRISEVTKARRLKFVEYGGGKCKRCGYNRCVGALEFHHRDPLEKDISINTARSLNDKVKGELDKCDLLCANCHREVHFELHYGVKLTTPKITGLKSGRKALDGAKDLKARNVYLDEKTVKKAVKIGQGSLSAGIRIAVKERKEG